MTDKTAKQFCIEGASLLTQGQYDRALEVCTIGLGKATTPAEQGALLYNIALSRYHVGKDDEALGALDRALATDRSTHYPIERAKEFLRFRNDPRFLQLLTKHGITERRHHPSLFYVLFSEKGRISRSTFWLKGVLRGIAINAVLVSLAFVCTNSESALAILSLPLILLALTIQLTPLMKRLQDRNRPGWLVLGLFIPLLNILIAIWMLVEAGFLRGTSGQNNYGVDPLTQT